MNKIENKLVFENENTELTLYILGMIKNLLNTAYLNQNIELNIESNNKDIIANFSYQANSIIKLREWLITLGQVFAKISPLNKLSDNESIIMQTKEMLDISALLIKIKFDRNQQLESLTDFDETFNNHLNATHTKFGMVLQNIS